MLNSSSLLASVLENQVFIYDFSSWNVWNKSQKVTILGILETLKLE